MIYLNLHIQEQFRKKANAIKQSTLEKMEKFSPKI